MCGNKCWGEKRDVVLEGCGLVWNQVTQWGGRRRASGRQGRRGREVSRA